MILRTIYSLVQLSNELSNLSERNIFKLILTLILNS